MKKLLTTLTIMSITAISSLSAYAGFTNIVIREGGGNPPTIQTNNDYVPGATEFIVDTGGMKAAMASNAINGATIGDITELKVTRYDDTTRFSPGSGPAVAPYFNIWVTDGGGNYAVIANEPSNPAFQPLFVTNGDGSKTYDLSYADISGTAAKVYETPGWNTNSSWVHTLFGNDPLTFADVASLQIEPPSAAYINNPTNGVGSGAPDELGTSTAYGFNWVFGDTLSNYVSGEEGYIVAGASAKAIPEPASFGMLALGGLALIRRRKLA